jgi:hypothetical protein
MLLVPEAARAACAGFEGQSVAQTPQAPAKPEPPVKVPAPPVFPKHRRGLYLNGDGLWVLDATPQSPPLIVDDPGVPDNGVYEINLTTDVDSSRGATKLDLLFVDANYGVLPKILGHELPTQLKFEMPVSAATDNGQPFVAGLGQAAVGVKFDFYHTEHHSMEMALYPQIAFAIGTSPAAKGLADAGETLILPLIVSKELKYVTVVVNGTVNKPVHDSERHLTGVFGGGVGLAVTRTLALMAELHSETRFDLAHDRLLLTNVGLMRAVGHSFVLYGNVGRSLFSDDGLAHTYAGVGVKVLIKPDGKAVHQGR